jgi:hypothetical protein
MVAAMVGASVLFGAATGDTALAHRSDFDTLTIDLIFDSDGLAVIDGALVESAGPGYEPFPSAELRHEVAERILAALDLPVAAAVIKAASSDRYHEVGFMITPPGRSGSRPVGAHIDTEPLRQITTSLDLTVLKVSVCGADAETFELLAVSAQHPGRQPLMSKSERIPCQVWELADNDPPVVITVGDANMESTGAGTAKALALPVALLVAGLVLVVTRRRSRLKA